MAQWLRFQGSTARDTGLIPGQGSSAWCCQKQKKSINLVPEVLILNSPPFKTYFSLVEPNITIILLVAKVKNLSPRKRQKEFFRIGRNIQYSYIVAGSQVYTSVYTYPAEHFKMVTFNQ